jgi:hypothetical protein
MRILKPAAKLPISDPVSISASKNGESSEEGDDYKHISYASVKPPADAFAHYSAEHLRDLVFLPGN